MADPTTVPHTAHTVRAIVHDRYGSADVLRVARVPRPAVADDEVLLQVHAAGLDRAPGT